ncbi:MAG: UvrD-helicase domain-containing protein [Proteobacteria bacterium]|nr:UvrD-helicase domain-containing protein [Pseudomonadota bacterium]
MGRLRASRRAQLRARLRTLARRQGELRDRHAGAQAPRCGCKGSAWRHRPRCRPGSAGMSRSQAAMPCDCARWQELPLAGAGCGLVEASAGTGKTWTITALYLRLLLECALGPRQIAVATFTNAAAENLRARIRERLQEGMALASAFDPDAPAPADEALAWLHGRWSQADGGARRVEDGERLRRGWFELDGAPIGTLHRLFGRALAEHPLASGSSFAVDEMIDGAELDAALREDLWRHLAQDPDSRLELGDRLWFAEGRTAFDTALARACTPGFGVLDIPVDASVIDDLKDPAKAAEIRSWLPNAPFKTVKSKMRAGMAALAGYIDAGDPFAPLPDDVVDRLSQPLVTQFKAGTAEVQGSHPLVGLAQQVVRVHAHARACALTRYRQRLLAARRQRLRERGQGTFDDVVQRMLDALAGPSGGALASRLCAAWPAALIDEFQDTDGRQFDILRRMYGIGAGAAAKGRLVMVGDPKQAIYGFRGGDVHAYLAARADATHRLRLVRNFRSTPELVQALNQWFALAGHALSQRSAAPICYEPVEAADRPERKRYTVDGQPLSRPLQFQEVAEPAAAGAREKALNYCANQVALMLEEGRHRIGGDPVKPGDIAVLVPNNNDIATLRDQLRERHVPCAAAGRSSVFATATARDLQCILFGVEHAGDEALVRAALATDLLGGLDRVRALREQPEAWREQMQVFARWRKLWQSQGVLALVQAILASRGAPGAATGDQRRATDLRHLGELLQVQSADCEGPQALLAWLADQRAGGAGEGDAGESRQLRIDSDDPRVQVMTLHAAKGLEFPVVFLPLADAGSIKAPSLPLHRTDAGLRLIDLGSTDRKAAIAATMDEEQDESFRQTYVALTRAKYACHVLVSNLHAKTTDPQRPAMTALRERMLKRLDRRQVEDACPNVAWKIHAAWPDDRHDYRAGTVPAVPAGILLDPPDPRPLEGRYSYSSFTRRGDRATDDTKAGDEPADAWDEDTTASSGEGDDAPSPASADSMGDPVSVPALGLPRRASPTAFGLAVHAILERRRIGVPIGEQPVLLRACLDEHGIAAHPALVETLATRLQDVLDAHLPVAGAPPLRLASLPAHALRAEMRFDYSLDGASLARLRGICERHGLPGLVPESRLGAMHGLMSGAIDLVVEHAGRFHVLDWKTNWLGKPVSGYMGQALLASMDTHHYRWQALLYTIALDRYLRQRVRGYDRARQLGAAVYLFVRAVGVAPGAGVWTWRFDDALIAAIDAELARGVEVDA